MSEESNSPAPINPADWIADPHACFARHRAEHWWAPIAGLNLTQVLEHRAVRELLSSAGPLCAYDGSYIEDVMRRNPAFTEEHIEFMRKATDRSLINTDGPEHDRLRQLVARAFTPRAVEQFAPTIDDLAREFAERLHPGDDFMEVFARGFPATAVCALLGIDTDDHVRFTSWTDVLEVETAPANLLKLDADGAAQVRRVQQEVHGFIRNLIIQRRFDPRDDLISRLIAQAGDEFEDDALVQLISDINFAANATTRNAIGNMVLALVQMPDVWESIAADASRAPAVVEEVLRLNGPTPGPVRRAADTFEYRDHVFAEGDVAALSIWSANRDEGFWGADANLFNPDRPHAGEHLTFGHGPHFCLGAAFARELLRASVVALTTRLTNITLTGKPTMLPPGGVYGPVSFRLDFSIRER